MSTAIEPCAETRSTRRRARRRMSASRPLYWSVRRELWEYRSIYVAPLAVAALFLFGFLISLIHLPARMRAAVGSIRCSASCLRQSVRPSPRF